MGLLDGKAVVVTGAGRGIGAAIAKLAASEGASVVVGDIDRAVAESMAAEIVKAGGKAVPHVADISNWKAAGGLIECCVDNYKKIDGLVNNAALYHLARIHELEEADLRRLIEANLIGTAATARHAVPHMMRQKSGSIVNVTSGAHFGMLATSSYGATKGGVASFIYTWSMELKEHNVRVNGLSPRAATRMMDVSAGYRAARGVQSHRPPPNDPPENNAPPVVFLLSDESKDVTGQIVRMDGHQLSLVAHPGVATPVFEREGGWDVASIIDAFRAELGKRQLPTGVQGLDIKPVKVEPIRWKR